jgi:ABC-type multidrug transport system ATPase subunit
MSERILRALMQLFAIVARVDEVSAEVENDPGGIKSSRGREIIGGFLKSELNSSDVTKYLAIFDEFLITTRGKLYAKSGGKKRTSLQSVKVLRICDQVNKELTQRQKFIVLVRVFEFINADHEFSQTELDFVETVSESFNVSNEEYDQVKRFVEAERKDTPDEKNHVYYYAGTPKNFTNAKTAFVEGIDGFIHAIHIESVKTVFFRYFGSHELFINGQIVDADKTHLFNIGSTVRTTKSSQIFYSDLISRINEKKNHQPISFKVDKISHTFKTGKTAVQEISLSSKEGQMVGIMGGSGTGKTTLMNIMNGNVKPTHGKLKVNGIDLHTNSRSLEGVIGNVSQNDLLIEELTVFQNLFFGAKLSIGGLTNSQLAKRVVEVLKSLGLYEIRRLKIGSSLDKVISGGQRKRLNIALELIREPSILFVDEPTSGLSSRDSENIMDLLKELSLNGKLIFVVIHQPSSNIFKLFDRLLIMDVGGYPIYDGNPLNAIVHFKTHSYRGNSHERECSLCGNVNPEQIFNLIDARIVDEYGAETQTRKKDAKDWNELYTIHKVTKKIETKDSKIDSSSKLPSKLIQLWTYFKRDLLSKVSNLQYVLVNLLVAPSLALILSFFIKYFDWRNGIESYSYFSNENIPQYIFISIIVSIFLGLTVSAEEINKDKEILSREKFLNLSRNSYLLSKISILFSISAIQSLMFVLIGNYILEIEGMLFEYWLVLFSTACVSNIAGLNISSAFNSAKVIYIIIPLLIIPQLLFSGVIVKFDKLHPSLSDATKVPWVGNMMVSRWAYEALTVEQASQNQLSKQTFEHDLLLSNAQWKKDYWLPELQSEKSIMLNANDFDNVVVANAKLTMTNELLKENELWGNWKCKGCFDDLATKTMTSEEDFESIDTFLDTLRLQWINTMTVEKKAIEKFIDITGAKEYRRLKDIYQNESLENLVTNKMEKNKIIVTPGYLYQNDDPIFNDPQRVSFFNSHFFAPYKYIFGKRYSTFQINLIIIWVISILSYVLLYFDVLRRMLVGMMRLSIRVRPNKKAPAAD